MFANTDDALETLPDARARAVLARAYADSRGEMRRLVWRYLPQVPRLVTGRPLRWDRLQHAHDDAAIPLAPTQGMFCYLAARAIGARRIVEFGTSFGLSTIYLALAVRDNGGGQVIGTEMVPAKAERARRNLQEAGLAELVEIRVGDARDTLRGLAGPVDLLLNDGFPPPMLAVLQTVAPAMRSGAVVISDNIGLFKADLADYVRWLRDPANGFHSSPLQMGELCELSVKR
jgi:predicted O-methyltransferase YrrM